MEHFLFTSDFLLTTDFAKRLYHGYAKHQPIIDYHCHLSPAEIANNKRFDNLSQVWLAGDHYKWRAMRTLGIPEKFITGNASAEEKFEQWAYALPYTMRNPLYHWSHLELSRYFGVEEYLNPKTAKDIWKICNEKLHDATYAPQGLITRMNVELIGTTDDPVDNLSHHQNIAQSDFNTHVVPTFRPDKAYAVEDLETYHRYLQKLEESSGVSITSFETFMEALEKRIHYFHENGCRLSDHGIEYFFFSEKAPRPIEEIFQSIQKKHPLSTPEINYFKHQVLREISKLYHQKGWTQQFHLGALRSVNVRMLATLGPDTGFDSIGDWNQSYNMAKFLNELESTNQLTKTILYNLNPADNEVIATMIGNFNDGSIKGKMQFGSGWWFLDQKDGMEKQLNCLSNMGLLSCFIGMLTDSRSFLSYPRHEYFRRILCNLIGQDVVQGELPADEKWLGKLVADICYHNAKTYFNFTK